MGGEIGCFKEERIVSAGAALGFAGLPAKEKVAAGDRYHEFVVLLVFDTVIIERPARQRVLRHNTPTRESGSPAIQRTIEE